VYRAHAGAHAVGTTGGGWWGGGVVPIPGTKRRGYLEQNVAAMEVALSDADLAAIESAFPVEGVAAGTRYPAFRMGELNR